MEDNFSTDEGGGDGSSGNASDGERCGVADEASLAGPPLTCCAAWLLTDRGPVPGPGPGVEDLCHSDTQDGFTGA